MANADLLIPARLRVRNLESRVLIGERLVDLAKSRLALTLIDSYLRILEPCMVGCLGGRPRFVQKTPDHSDTLPCEFLPEEAFFFESYIPSPFALMGHVSDRTGLLLPLCLEHKAPTSWHHHQGQSDISPIPPSPFPQYSSTFNFCLAPPF